MPIVEVPFEVEFNYGGWRLDRYLQQKINRLSRQQIQGLIRTKLVCASRHLKPGSIVTPGLKFHLLKETVTEREAATRDEIGVIFDDPYLIVLDKPSGIAVHPSARYFRHTVTQWLHDHATGDDDVRPDLAHRLDRETSGVLVCGRGPVATRLLKKAFRDRKVEKTYTAICEGHAAEDTFEIDAPMRLTERVKVVMEVHPDGLPSSTGVRVLRRGRFRNDGAPCTLVECHPHTGRQHQIRVHLAHVGLPLVGDKIYGGGVENFLRYFEGTQTDEDRARMRFPRQALHASAISLPHPHTGERLTIVAPFAADLQAFSDAEIEWK